MTTIIGLTSTAMGAGKSTVAKILTEKHGFVSLAFAGPLKAVTQALFTAMGIHPVDVQRFVYGDWKEEVVPGLTAIHVADFDTLVVRTLIEQTGLSSVDVETYMVTGTMVVPVLGCSVLSLMVKFQEFVARYLTDEPMTSRRWQQLLGTEFGRQMIHDEIWTSIAMARAATLDKVVFDDMRFPNEYQIIRDAGGSTFRVHRPSAAVTIAHASEGQLDHIPMPMIHNTGSLEYLRHQVAAAIESLR